MKNDYNNENNTWVENPRPVRNNPSQCQQQKQILWKKIFPSARMNSTSVIVVGLLQLLLVIEGTQVSDEGKRVLCYYGAIPNPIGVILEPEDIDVTLCTHLVYINGQINNETGAVEPKIAEFAYYENGGKGHYDRIRKLKEINTELKILLHVDLCGGIKIPVTSSGRSNYIRSAVAILQQHGFDGLLVEWVLPTDEEKSLSETYFASLLYEVRAEFDRHGFILSTFLPVDERISHVDHDLGVIVRTCDFVTVKTIYYWGPWDGVTGLFSSLTSVKSSIDIYLSKNVPANKMLILITTMGIMAQLANVNESSLGAEAHPIDPERYGYSAIISYGKLVKRFGNQTENWDMHRDEATKSPYASNKDGLWVSYDDTTSVAVKSRYAVENKLGGVSVMAFDLEDYEGNGGEGRYALTRTIYDTVTKK